ncbi:MAG: hypothetical protein R3B60_00970 [Candidatus Paceibacterota bacterium]
MNKEELMIKINKLQHEVGVLSLNALGELIDDNDSVSYAEENIRIERYLSDFTLRQGVLITIAGLFTLMPIVKDEAVKYFLIWVFPFLLGAIVTYTLSTKRINFISKNTTISLDKMEVNRILKENYYKSVFFHKITDILIVIFFITFITNYYFIIFIGIPHLIVSILLLSVSFFVGFIRYWFISDNENNNELNYIGVGGECESVLDKK